MTTKITGDNITDGSVTTDDLNAAAESSGATDLNAFNIGVLGFKIAVNEGNREWNCSKTNHRLWCVWYNFNFYNCTSEHSTDWCQIFSSIG